MRHRVAPFRRTLRGEVQAAAPLEPGEQVLVDRQIVRGGAWVPRLGFLRVTDRRVLILVGRWLGRNDVIEIPRSLVRVRSAPVFDPVIRLEVGAPVDDDVLAFRAWDWIPPPTTPGISLRVRHQSVMTTRLRELLVDVLGRSDDTRGRSG